MSLKIDDNSIVSSSDFVRKFKDCTNFVKAGNDLVIIRNNKPDLVLLDYKEYARLKSLEESMQLARTIIDRKASDDGQRFTLDEVKKMFNK